MARGRREPRVQEASANGRFPGRRFDYPPERAPHPLLAERDRQTGSVFAAVESGEYSIGYPAWNLLYDALVASGAPVNRPLVVVETGTNVGLSTIVLAQGVRELGGRGIVHTVDIDPQCSARARTNVDRAGLTDLVSFAEGESVPFLIDLASRERWIDFAFLDGSHEATVVLEEFDAIFDAIVAAHGKVYFDNTAGGGVREALQDIRYRYGGSLVEFDGCSWNPPGNAIWQPR